MVDFIAPLIIAALAGGAWFSAVCAGRVLDQPKPRSTYWFIGSVISVQAVAMGAWIAGRFLSMVG